jgi:L-fuculose-phosphate aldolase
MTELHIRQDIVECGRRLFEKGYVAANDGNISVRIGPNEILATPTGRSKGFMRVDELVRIDRRGNLLEGHLKPSTEMLMHLAIYEERPDINAVVHAHPVHATGFATANVPLEKCVLAEIITTLGSIPIAPYGTPSTKELPDSIREIIRHADACLLANHGALTCGKDVFDAYFKMERVEHYAHIMFVAKMLGGEKVLNTAQVEKLQSIRSTYGTADHRNPGCITCSDNCIGNDCTLYEKRDSIVETFRRSESSSAGAAFQEEQIKQIIRDLIQSA